MNKPVEFLPVTPETPPMFPCWAYDYEWKMVFVRGHFLDQYTHWAPGGCPAPTARPNYVPPTPPTPAGAGTDTPLEREVHSLREELRIEREGHNLLRSRVMYSAGPAEAKSACAQMMHEEFERNRSELINRL